MVVIAIVAIVVVNATGGNDASAKAFGTEMKIAYFSAFPSEEKLLDYVSKEVAPDYGLTVTPVSLGEPQQIDRSVSEFHARVVQHEVDHLDGILYPRRIRDLTQFGFNEALFPGETLIDD